MKLPLTLLAFFAMSVAFAADGTPAATPPSPTPDHALDKPGNRMDKPLHQKPGSPVKKNKKLTTEEEKKLEQKLPDEQAKNAPAPGTPSN